MELEKEYRFEDGIESLRKRIDSGKYVKSEIAIVSSIRFNRTKFNRMGRGEQDEYERKLAKMKKEYRLFYSDETFIVVSKSVYEYFNKRNSGKTTDKVRG